MQRREGCTQSQILAGLSKKPSVQKMAATLNALTSNHRIKLSQVSLLPRRPPLLLAPRAVHDEQTPNGEVLYQKMTESAARALKYLAVTSHLTTRHVAQAHIGTAAIRTQIHIE